MGNAISLLIIIGQPGFKLIKQVAESNQYAPYQKYTTSLAGKSWIEENLVPGSKIILYGYYAFLPRIVDERSEVQGDVGEYFMYGRIHNKPYKKLYEKAYKEFIVGQGRPTFNITKYGSTNCEENAVVKNAIDKGNYDYLITYCDLGEDFKKSSRIIKYFGRNNYRYGKPFWIFKL